MHKGHYHDDRRSGGIQAPNHERIWIPFTVLLNTISCGGKRGSWKPNDLFKIFKIIKVMSQIKLWGMTPMKIEVRVSPDGHFLSNSKYEIKL